MNRQLNAVVGSTFQACSTDVCCRSVQSSGHSAAPAAGWRDGCCAGHILPGRYRTVSQGTGATQSLRSYTLKLGVFVKVCGRQRIK